MNIHPAFVHFPIALLTVYGVFECFRWRKLLVLESWTIVKAVLLWVGVIGAFFALQTGDVAESFHRNQRALVDVHSSFATATTIIFGVVAVYYVLKIGDSYFRKISLGKKYERFVLNILKIQKVFKTPIVIVLALAGLVTLVITGALGASIVYGPDVDPIVSFTYHLFF
jgi:uncharacterized membrane protein